MVAEVIGVSVRYFAAAADAAGCVKETLALPATADLGQVKSMLIVL